MKILIYKNGSQIMAYCKRDEQLENALDTFLNHQYNSNIKLGYMEWPVWGELRRSVRFWFSWITNNVMFEFSKEKIDKHSPLYICDYELKSYSMESLKEFFIWFINFKKLYAI